MLNVLLVFGNDVKYVFFFMFKTLLYNHVTFCELITQHNYIQSGVSVDLLPFTMLLATRHTTTAYIVTAVKNVSGHFRQPTC